LSDVDRSFGIDSNREGNEMMKEFRIRLRIGGLDEEASSGEEEIAKLV